MTTLNGPSAASQIGGPASAGWCRASLDRRSLRLLTTLRAHPNQAHASSAYRPSADDLTPLPNPHAQTVLCLAADRRSPSYRYRTNNLADLVSPRKRWPSLNSRLRGRTRGRPLRDHDREISLYRVAICCACRASARLARSCDDATAPDGRSIATAGRSSTATYSARASDSRPVR